MRKLLFSFALVLFSLMCTVPAHAADDADIREHKNCKTCGMSREMFSYSRVLIEYTNGTTAGTCSIRCAAVELALNMGRMTKSIRVGDFNSRQLIDAEKAYWVIGGNKQGTMSSRGKWAFLKKDKADSFMAKNGGTAGTFYDALKASFNDLYNDLKLFWNDAKKRSQE